MNIESILKKVGGAIIRDAVPGGGLIVDAINSVLPDDKKLDATATGIQAQTAVNALPPEQRAPIMTKELDVEMTQANAWAQVVDSLSKADAAGSSTRPQIAVMMARVVAFAVIMATASWAIAIFSGKTDLLKTLNDSWGLLLAILGTPTALLRAYFGMRSDEKKARYAAATGGQVQPSGLLAGLASLMKR